jgi:hypothetical protein
MAVPCAASLTERLAMAHALDELWSETMGLEEGDTKEGPLAIGPDFTAD